MPNLLALTDDTLLQILASGCDRRSPYEIIIGAPVLPAMIIGAADLVRLGLVARRFAAKAFSGPQQADTWSLASEAARRRVLAHDRADCVPRRGREPWIGLLRELQHPDVEFSVCVCVVCMCVCVCSCVYICARLLVLLLACACV